MLDLHIHTTASDGSLTPTQVVQLARKKGFSLIAVTDHDTMGGVAEALEAGKKVLLLDAEDEYRERNIT